MNIELKHSKSAARTAAFALIAEGWNEMVQEGVTPDLLGVPPFSAESQVVYAKSDDGDIVGVVVVQHQADVLQVQLAYVEPSSRKCGVFRKLMNAARDLAETQGAAGLRVNVPSESDIADILSKMGYVPVTTGFGSPS